MIGNQKFSQLLIQHQGTSIKLWVKSQAMRLGKPREQEKESVQPGMPFFKYRVKRSDKELVVFGHTLSTLKWEIKSGVWEPTRERFEKKRWMKLSNFSKLWKKQREIQFKTWRLKMNSIFLMVLGLTTSLRRRWTWSTTKSFRTIALWMILLWNLVTWTTVMP